MQNLEQTDTMEVSNEVSKELQRVINQSGLEAVTKKMLEEKFSGFSREADNWAAKAALLVVTDKSQVAEMKAARVARLALKNILIEADRVRKALKQDSLRYGQSIQAIYNFIYEKIEPIKEHLKLQEEFAERQEETRLANLKAIRDAELHPYRLFVPRGVLPEEMSEEQYGRFFQTIKKKFEIEREAELEAMKQEEENRAAQLAAFEANRIAQEAEIARLQAVQAEHEAQLKFERQQAAEALELQRKEDAERQRIAKIESDRLEAKRQDVLRIEREAAAVVAAQLAKERELRMIQQRQQERQAAEERKALLAPDTEKLKALAKFFADITHPSVSSNEAAEILKNVKTLLSKIEQYILLKVSEM